MPICRDQQQAQQQMLELNKARVNSENAKAVKLQAEADNIGNDKELILKHIETMIDANVQDKKVKAEILKAMLSLEGSKVDR